jgi:broad specificity phosphatase PhoE
MPAVSANGWSDSPLRRSLRVPLQRAPRTCELAGFRAAAEIDRDLVEWNYGDYEGHRTVEIHKERPDWQLFCDGCPGGELPDHVGARADRVVSRVRAIKGDVLIFSSGHFCECSLRAGLDSSLLPGDFSC